MWSATDRQISTRHELCCQSRLQLQSARSGDPTAQRQPPLAIRIHERISFKLCLMLYKAIFGLAPSYISELCVPVTSIPPRSSLQSAAHGILFVPQSRLELGKHAFAVAGPAYWNNLPDSVWSAPTRDVFKQRLKTYLFRQSYNL